MSYWKSIGNQFYGGPFFDSSHQFMYNHLIPTNVSLGKSIESLWGEDKRLFLQLAKRMLRWLPEERATAEELLQEPWLRDASRWPSANSLIYRPQKKPFTEPHIHFEFDEGVDDDEFICDPALMDMPNLAPNVAEGVPPQRHSSEQEHEP